MYVICIYIYTFIGSLFQVLNEYYFLSVAIDTQFVATQVIEIIEIQLGSLSIIVHLVDNHG